MTLFNKKKMKNLYIILIGLTTLATSCGKEEEQKEAQAFKLTTTVSQGKEIAEAKTQPVTTELILNGKITLDEDKVARVFPLAGGFVKELYVELGDYVKKGQVLAIIRSPEIAGFTREGVEAEAQLRVAEKNMQVASQLYETGNISEIELINAKKELESAKGEVERTRAVLDMYSAGKESVYPIKSPVSGVIVHKDVALNMELRTEDISPVFIVGSLEEVWVMANVYESDIPNLKEGYDAQIVTTSYPDKIYKGKIDKIFNIIDAQTRVLRARITLPNPTFELKPEMFAQVRVRYNEPFSKVTVPSSAIIFDKSRHFVMVYKSDENIETREVKIHSENVDTTYIESGLQDGEKVMTKYQLLVYDALND
jgi:membrane fusion protein, heavy metal efflux system